jgi:transposase-like protein
VRDATVGGTQELPPGPRRNRCTRLPAESLEEAGDRLFTFARLPPSQWRSARTTNAIERLHEEFKRRIKTQTVLPSADTAAMLLPRA